jgi:NAD(P)-dependent dehydrogenase (short-subunit alcohol dehydrogenase family)
MPLAPLAKVDDARFERLVALNLGGVFRGMREAARRMRDGGRIISFSSSVVGLFQPTYGVYAATKAGVEALTHVLAKELGRRDHRQRRFAGADGNGALPYRPDRPRQRRRALTGIRRGPRRARLRP